MDYMKFKFTKFASKSIENFSNLFKDINYINMLYGLITCLYISLKRFEKFSMLFDAK
jgi:hypothetical protein